MNLRFVIVVTLGLLGLSELCAASPDKPGGKPDPTSFFAGTNVLRIRIEIPAEAMEKLGKYRWQFGPQTERENVRVTVREGQSVFTNVALHLKGSAGSFRPVSENPAMTLHFDKFVPGQRFHGLTKLNLNNSVQDPTLVSEQFSRELFLQAGVPVPRATQVVVELNGRDLGLYVLVEGFNKQFLKRHFKDANGHLYDGGFVKDIDAELSLNSGENPKDQSDRIALLDAAREPDLKKRLAALQKALDLDRFLTYMALDVMLWDWDGYSQNRNNWRLYHDPSSGKMVFIPHGLDQMFWKPEGSILPPMQGLVSKSVLQIPELRARYFERMKDLRKLVFQPEVLTNRVQAIAAKFRPILLARDSESAREQDKALTAFCEAIVRRARSIDEQLATPITPLKFDGAGVTVLANWEAKAVFGAPEMTRTRAEVGEVLRLGAKDGSSIGTWRSQVWLEHGRYRVEARLKADGIVADVGDPRGGAGLRVGRERSEDRAIGSTEWKTISHEFSVEDPIGQVPIACEFRGASGAAAFENVTLRHLPDAGK